MRPLSLCSVLVLCAIAGSANADWVKSEVQDHMRGTSKTVYLTEAKPIGEDGPLIGLRVFDDQEGHPGVSFGLSQGAFAGCENRQCEIELRFDNGAVKKVTFASDSGRSITPSEMVSFAGALKLSKTLYAEFDVGQERRLQYKFDVDELPVDVSRKPEILLIGYELGRKYSDADISLRKYREADGQSCYSGSDRETPFGKQPVNKVSLCFSDGYLRTTIIEPGTRAAYSEGVSFLTKAFGQSDKESTYPRWPKSEGKRIDLHTKSASYLGGSKAEKGSVFILSDSVADLITQ